MTENKENTPKYSKAVVLFLCLQTLTWGFFASDKIPLVQTIAYHGLNCCWYRADTQIYHSHFLSSTLRSTWQEAVQTQPQKLVSHRFCINVKPVFSTTSDNKDFQLSSWTPGFWGTEWIALENERRFAQKDLCRQHKEVFPKLCQQCAKLLKNVLSIWESNSGFKPTSILVKGKEIC